MFFENTISLRGNILYRVLVVQNAGLPFVQICVEIYVWDARVIEFFLGWLSHIHVWKSATNTNWYDISVRRDYALSAP